MKILFVHQNMPGQYRHLAPVPVTISGNEVMLLTQRYDVSLPDIPVHGYRPHRAPRDGRHRYLSETVLAAVADGKTFAAIRRRARETILDRYNQRSICLPEHLRCIRGMERGLQGFLPNEREGYRHSITTCVSNRSHC